jgi:hypothetical protein
MFRNTMAMAGVLGLLAGSASAGVTFYSFGTGAPDAPLVTNFSGDTVGDAPTTAAPGFSWAGGGTGYILGASASDGAEPAIAPNVQQTGNFLALNTGDTETLTVSASNIDHIFVYVGSLDSFNDISFAGPGVSYTGAQLAAYSGADNGNQTQGQTNGVFEFSFSTPVTGVTFSSGGTAFEIASISAGTPEPAAWAVMLIGIGGIGAAMRLRRRQVAATA